MNATEKNRLDRANDISKQIVDSSIAIIDDKFNRDYHKQNPHILSAVIELQKAIYLTVEK